MGHNVQNFFKSEKKLRTAAATTNSVYLILSTFVYNILPKEEKIILDHFKLTSTSAYARTLLCTHILLANKLQHQHMHALAYTHTHMRARVQVLGQSQFPAVFSLSVPPMLFLMTLYRLQML